MRIGTGRSAAWRRLYTLVLIAAGAGAAGACDREPRGEPSAQIRQVIAQGQRPTLRLANGDTLRLSPAVVAFYRERGYRQAWTDYDEILGRGTRLLGLMGRTEADGLDPEAYRYAVAERMVRQVEEDSLKESQEPGQMSLVDMALSEVFARYASHLARGTVDPKESGLDWRIPPDTVPVGRLLRAVANDEGPARLIAGLRPTSPEYRRLQEALARYERIQAQGGWPTLPAKTTAKVGASGVAVGALRGRLIAEGDPVERPLAAAGNASPNTFDRRLREALKHFQRRHGVDADGGLGPQTVAALNVPVEQRVLQLRLNLDRWRWLPRNLGQRYVLVNVAGFDMDVVDGGKVVMNQNVVVGQQGWETPIFRDTMEAIVINPTWTVPPSIAEKEIIPAIQRDPGYLRAENFEVLRGGHAVGGSSISAAAVASGDVVIRQRPGPKNALGQVKFLFPNKDDIYLHDTPADQLFSESDRAFSHGCIRVEKPVELAHLIMRMATDVPPERFEQLRATGETHEIRLARPLPIYILYFTSWVEDDGSVRFYQDVYRQDRQLDQQAREKLERVAAR